MMAILRKRQGAKPVLCYNIEAGEGCSAFAALNEPERRGRMSADDQQGRSPSEQLAFKAAELDGMMIAAGFKLAHADPEAARDFSYRARYIRSKSTMHPCLHAYLEYYSAVRAFSLKISASEEHLAGTYDLVVKNHRESLRDLLERYFAVVRKGVPLSPEELKR
jgi:hypothetical protein